jgi:hypothetical protein
MVYPALLPLMRTPRLPVVDWNDAPADLNGLVLFAERRNLVSARVPSHFICPLTLGYFLGPQSIRSLWGREGKTFFPPYLQELNPDSSVTHSVSSHLSNWSVPVHSSSYCKITKIICILGVEVRFAGKKVDWWVCTKQTGFHSNTIIHLLQLSYKFRPSTGPSQAGK